MNRSVCVVLAFLAAGLARAQDVRRAPLEGADVAGLGKVSADEPLSFAFRAPGRWLARAVREAREILPDDMEAGLAGMLDEAASNAGFQLEEPESWIGIGLDPDGDVALSLGDPGGWIGLPQRALTVLPAVDVERLAGFVVEQEDADAGQRMVPIVGDGMAAPGLAFRPVGRTLVLLGHTAVQDAEAMAEALDRAISALGAGQTVGATTVHRAVAQRIGGDPWGAVFVRPSRWKSDEPQPQDQEESAPEPLVESFLAAFGPRSIVAALHLKPSAERRKLLARGADPRIALRTMPEPAAVLTASFADIDALFVSLAADDDEVAAIRGDQIELVDMLGPLLRGGSLGLLAYPSPRGVEPLWAAFAATGDHDAAVAAVGKAVAGAPVEVRPLDAPEGARLWHSPSEGVVLGVRGGIVYAGNAVEQVTATVRGEVEGHEPEISGDALLELHVTLRDVLGQDAVAAPGPLVEGGLTGRVDVDGDVLVGTLRRTGGDAATSWLGEAIAWAAFAAASDGSVPRTPQEEARAEVTAIHAAVTVFATKNGRVPTMEDLLERDATGHPYIESDEAPVDPWGNAYVIENLEGRLRFEVRSFGPDGVKGTADDITHPQRR